MNVNKKYNLIKNSKQNQVFIKEGEVLKPVKLEDLKHNGEKIGEKIKRLEMKKEVVKLLKEKLKSKGYNIEEFYYSLRESKIKSYEKVRRQKILKDLINKGVL